SCTVQSGVLDGPGWNSAPLTAEKGDGGPPEESYYPDAPRFRFASIFYQNVEILYVRTVYTSHEKYQFAGLSCI
ncbi:MAG: hypothetical protein ACRDSJ_16720, partial [Rubrobacteraceae bacterium]